MPPLPPLPPPRIPVRCDSRLHEFLVQPGAAEILGAVVLWQVQTHRAIWPDVAAAGLRVATALARLAPRNWYGVSGALALLRDGSWPSYQDAVRACAVVARHATYRLANGEDGIHAVLATQPTPDDPPGPPPRHAPVALPTPLPPFLTDPAAAAIIGAAQVGHLLDGSALAWAPHPQATWAAEAITRSYPARAAVARAALAILDWRAADPSSPHPPADQAGACDECP